MGRRVYLRWAHAAWTALGGWFYRLASIRFCKSIVHQRSKDLALELGKRCPGGVCEYASVGKHGSPGRVRSSEQLHSVLIFPFDLTEDQIGLHFATQAQKSGLSILRGKASNDEFALTKAQRLSKGPPRELYGFATFSCAELRKLVAPETTVHRQKGERLFYVIDSDLRDKPHHADIFATLPRHESKGALERAFRSEREELVRLMGARISKPSEFRGGILA